MIKKMEKENLERDRELQEMEMEMKMGCDSFIKMEKVKGDVKGESFVEKMDMGEEKKDFLGHKNGVEVVGGCNNKDGPPVDDVCPICFDSFTVPCKSSCGHWFCGGCILQFWMYRSSIRPCKCPLCCCRIVKLNAETSDLVLPTDDTVEVLKKVQQYNDLYTTGGHGVFLKIRALPFFLRRIVGLLMNPQGLRCIYYVMRLLGLLLALLYEKAEFEFIPTGGLGIRRAFDMGASLVVMILFLVSVGHRWVLRSRERYMALALQEPDTS